VGRAVAASGIPRAEIFVTTKLATEDQGFMKAQDACKASLERLGMDYVDLYLIHWPGGDAGRYVHSWGGMMKEKEDGRAKSIGVANFTAEDLSNVVDLSFFVPAVNQIELHRCSIKPRCGGQCRARRRDRGVRAARRRQAVGELDHPVDRR